jgi:hypothetical protein
MIAAAKGEAPLQPPHSHAGEPPTVGDGDAAACETAAKALVAELQGLVRLVAHRSDIIVREGEPGCGWSFDFAQNLVTVDAESVRSLAPDLCRGLALHEASHAAVTVLHTIMPMGTLGRLRPLLNVVEDIRIEIWMRSRFPGAAPWMRAYNDVFCGLGRSRPPSRSRQMQFLRGVLDLWWYGAAVPGTLPEVLAALARCREPIAGAAACQPPLDNDPAGILASQRAMWQIVRDRVVPIWDKLVALDERDGIGPIAAAECREFAAATGADCRGGCRTRKVASTSSAGGRGHGGRAAAAGRAIGKQLAESLSGGDGDAYQAAWRRVAPAANRLGDEILRVLVPTTRMRWRAGNPSGTRLDLRVAMQFEADARLHTSLWCRPILPRRRDPAIALLVDRSSSMAEGGRMKRAFDGLVLLVEVCHRIGVPVAVWSFADDVSGDLGWNAPLDAAARRRLGELPGECRGMTDMAAALDVVRKSFSERHGDPKILIVLGDGEPNRREPTLAAVGRLEQAGIATIGLGLGPGTASLEKYFRCAATEIPSERIVEHVARVLEQSLLEAGTRAAGAS